MTSKSPGPPGRTGIVRGGRLPAEELIEERVRRGGVGDGELEEDERTGHQVASSGGRNFMVISISSRSEPARTG